MKKTFSIFIISLAFFSSSAWAQTITPTSNATPSPKATISPEATTTPSDRLQQIKERVGERIQAIKDQVNKKGFWGTLSQVNNSTLVLDTSRGERRVKTTEDTKILLDNKEVKFADLGIGNFIISMGNWDNKSEVLTAKRILSFSKPPKPAVERLVVSGKVTDVTLDDKVFVVNNPKKPGISYQIKASSKTVINTQVGDSTKKINFESLTVGRQVTVVVTKDKDKGSYTAKLIFALPAQASQDATTPTPSIQATLSPTPSVKATKPTPTPTLAE
ncbi:MAG: hypothetical protein Q7S03_00720 [bacterium]|nr:hypothetical protein [bacterium]